MKANEGCEQLGLVSNNHFTAHPGASRCSQKG